MLHWSSTLKIKCIINNYGTKIKVSTVQWEDTFMQNLVQYNDNTDIDLFQYFMRAAGSSEMRLKKVDVSIVLSLTTSLLLWQRYIVMQIKWRHSAQ